MYKIICSSLAVRVYNERAIVPIPNLKGIVISVLVCSVFHFVNFRRFGDLRKSFLVSVIVHKQRMKWIISVFWDFQTWCNVWHTQCVIFEWWLKEMCIEQTCLINISRGFVFFIECFSIFIFSILVIWKRDFWTSSILPNQTL